jgi:uncharacterized protein YecE (DUF72 family)
MAGLWIGTSGWHYDHWRGPFYPEDLPKPLTHVFEFRHESWFGEETMEQLKRHNVAFCSYDMADMGCPVVATASFVYMRFHGSEAQYESNYSDKMLEGWAGELKKLAKGLDEVWVYFNNDAQGFAVSNARRLAELLDAPLPDAK